MAQRHKYLAKARAVLDGQDAHGEAVTDARGGGDARRDDAQEPRASAPPRESVPAYERNEFNEQSPPVDDASATALAMARLRAGLTKRLQHWEDERLQALVLWNLVIAFDRGDAAGFRRHLAPSLAALTDADIATLVDWPLLATLERRLWESDPSAAEHVSRGAQKLAAWWNARRDRPAEDEASIGERNRTPDVDGPRLEGL